MGAFMWLLCAFGAVVAGDEGANTSEGWMGVGEEVGLNSTWDPLDECDIDSVASQDRCQ